MPEQVRHDEFEMPAPIAMLNVFQHSGAGV